MGGPGKRLLASILGVAGAAGLAAGIVMFTDARLGSVQADLTQEKIYTLSPGTRAVLAGLKEPVTLRLFYSPRLGTEVPSFGSYADQVREMLHRYAALSHGMVRVETLDPEPFSAAEDRALAYGLQGVPLNQSGEQVYFGIAGTNMLDDERSIAFLNPDRERFLEYDLTKLVWSLSNPKKPVVGIMTPLPVDGDPRMMMMTRGQAGRPWLSLMLLRESDVVKTVATDATAIDPDVQVLVLAQPQHLSQATLYAIDQFVMRGGRLMVLVDPRSEAQAGLPGPGGQPPADTSSNLRKLFDAWGIAFTPDKVVGDLTGAWQVRARPGDRVEAVQYLPWFNIRAGISPTDPATADLHQITVASAGYLEKKPGASIDFTPILQTDRKSGLIPLSEVGNDADPARILAGFHPDGVRRVIAARIHGVLHSAFSGPPAEPAAAPGAPKPALPGPYRAETDGPANLVVIADTDLLSDRFWVREQDFFGQQNPQPFSDNGPFIANIVGSLAGGDALIGLRGRGPSIRPFTVVENMQREAEAHFRQTEQALQQHLSATEAKLQMLRRGSASGEGRTTLTPEQEQAIAEARREIVDTQAKLRTVQHDLRRDIDALETRTRLFDIIAVPAALTLLAIVIGLVRRRRRARARG